MRGHFADLCLLASLLLVLALCWRGPEAGRRPELGDAARAAVEKQLGVGPASDASPVRAAAPAAKGAPG